ncbi:GNAT family N-acetyltransferase [Vibrio vulnificus]|uniref:GNAT family N-acetyltransferase n=1 Tax=Vibrio vulnificus TaxID=672 RepID=UPI001CDD3EC1|nr:GNAT family N-acetyltransferase [Vibrio vulnificus]MCA4015532.1 GNAT family N-acetyltransferase [Vibrio vulnificus]
MKIETDRLVLRQWRDDDYQPYAALCSDPHVMRYFLAPLSHAESYEQAEKIKKLILDKGWGFWAVELKATGQFIGFVGLHSQDEDSGFPNAPFLEIGWRLSSEFWGLGYAPEAAQKALQFAFEKLDAPTGFAFTTLQNRPSQRVMLKLGMVDTKQDFSHPKVVKGHPLERHCLYEITREQWLGKSA